MEEIKFLRSISRSEVALFGGKGSSLGELKGIKNVNVPEGFVLSTEIDLKNLEEFSNEILNNFDKLKIKTVAVRSSATKEDAFDTSFAGQFDTFLNVTRDKLIEKISECYNSLNSERIINYCKGKHVNPEEIKIAVVVQKMIQSEISGIAFSNNPINKNANEIMVEAGFGLGEYMVSGIITPDKYIFDKKSKKIIDKKINYQEFKLCFNEDRLENERLEVSLEKRNAQKLPTKYFLSLLENILDIEAHYGRPMDIEWAIEGGIIYITQARPITTLFL